MIDIFGREELERFRRIIAVRLGLQFDEAKFELLADVLRRRLAARHLSSTTEYLRDLECKTNGHDELRELTCYLTVAETYLFRGADQFRALEETVLPDRIRRRSVVRQLRLLSAGCASGEEAYSLAILLRERFPEMVSWNVTILGVDLNPAMLVKATRARYQAWSLRETSLATREKFFCREGGVYELDQRIRSMVSFEERNLVFDDPTGADFDVILCRNMMMYLVPSAVEAVIARLTRILAARGYLFLGHAETLRGLSQQFELQHTHETFYYRKREGMPAPVTGDRRLSGLASQPVFPAATWMDEVQRASDRISTLSRELQDRAQTVLPQAREPGKGSTAPVSVELGLVFELLRQERFQEALKAIREASPQAGQEPDTLLLRTVLLINCGDLGAAERSCRDILAVDDLNAGAHYLMALCCEHFGDINAAMEHDRKAIHLDSTFAMPHLHLGRLARRAWDTWTARRELEDASLLLVREETARILLFGGGFSREALVNLSRAESRACGAPV